jgi:hypothetical protein
MHRPFTHRCWQWLFLGIAIVTLFTGCQLFPASITDNTEPSADATYENEEPAAQPARK